MYKFYEFFAGGGMARMGLGPQWSCLFANDFDHKKSLIYGKNWGEGALKTSDVKSLKTDDLPGQSNLIWASFPCQDLSLAGGGAGLKGDRSGTFWPFWGLMKALISENRGPEIIVLENVCGTLTSHGGSDFATIITALRKADYRCGALVIDASLFVPQSRSRLFIIGVRNEVELLNDLISSKPIQLWHSRPLQTAYDALTASNKDNWIWWSLPKPPLRTMEFADLIEDNPENISWHTQEETSKLLMMMSKVNHAKVDKAKQSGRRMVGTIYKRTRQDKNGFRVQRAEVRFDNIAGCLRTPAGGSSRQIIMVVDGDCVRSRMISSRETARLMGLPDDYVLPENYNEAYHLTGDGVVVPVVRHLAEQIFAPLLAQKKIMKQKAA